MSCVPTRLVMASFKIAENCFNWFEKIFIVGQICVKPQLNVPLARPVYVTAVLLFKSFRIPLSVKN